MEYSDGSQLVPETQHEKPLFDTCVICLEPISERAITVPCDHVVFDYLCLLNWAQDHPSCPLCKTKLEAIQYDWASPEDYKTYNVPHGTSTSVERRSETSHSSRRLLSRRPRCQNRRPAYPLVAANDDAAIDRRRHVYRSQLFSYHVGSNRTSQFKDFTPYTFSHDKTLQNRAREFIRRELQVFEFLKTDNMQPRHPDIAVRRYRSTFSNSEFVLEYIMSILGTKDIRDCSGEAERMIGEFLGADNTRLFLHELNAFLRSPYELKYWDMHVQYGNASSFHLQ